MYSKDCESAVEISSGFPASVTGDSSLLNCHKLPDISEKLSLYSIKLYVVMPRLSAVSMCSSFIRVMHYVNGAQFLNATLAFAPPPVAVISLVTSIYASE